MTVCPAKAPVCPFQSGHRHPLQVRAALLGHVRKAPGDLRRSFGRGEAGTGLLGPAGPVGEVAQAQDVVVVGVGEEHRVHPVHAFSSHLQPWLGRGINKDASGPSTSAEGRVRALSPVERASSQTAQWHHQRGTPWESLEPRKRSVGMLAQNLNGVKTATTGPFERAAQLFDRPQELHHLGGDFLAPHDDRRARRVS